MKNDVLVVIDCGNTSTKLTAFEGDKIILRKRIERGGEDEIPELMAECGASAAVYCSVGRMDVRLVETVRCLVDDNLLVVTHGTEFPMEIRYATPQTLGIDRIAAAAGVVAVLPENQEGGVLVVDAGTAITEDVVTLRKEGMPVFHGGRIAPGFALRYEALHRLTAALPHLEVAKGESPVIGDSTDNSIRSGVQRGAADEVAGAFMELRKEFSLNTILITGGDGEILAEDLRKVMDRIGCAGRKDAGDEDVRKNDAGDEATEDKDVEIRYIPDLLPLGLRKIYEYCLLRSQREV